MSRAGEAVAVALLAGLALAALALWQREGLTLVNAMTLGFCL